MGFNKELALKLAELSGKSYSTLTYRYKDNGFYIELDDEGNQIVSFPGSYEISDWIENTEFVKVYRHGMGKLHNGFVDRYGEIRHELYKRLDKSKPIILTGHSQGGSIATICALSLFNKGYNIKSVYSFGSPRCGDSSWMEYFNKSKIECYRVKNGRDIVTEIPKILFEHVGKEIRVNKPGWFSWFVNRFLDHRLENYIKGLKKL